MFRSGDRVFSIRKYYDADDVYFGTFACYLDQKNQCMVLWDAIPHRTSIMEVDGIEGCAAVKLVNKFNVRS